MRYVVTVEGEVQVDADNEDDACMKAGDPSEWLGTGAQDYDWFSTGCVLDAKDNVPDKEPELDGLP